MYNINLILTYDNPDVFLETDQVNDTEKEFIRNVIYRQELLNLFCLEEYNDASLNGAMYELYKIIKKNKMFKKNMLKLADGIMQTDMIAGLIVLYSYDYMHATHKCVSEYLETGKISLSNINNLETIINSSPQVSSPQVSLLQLNSPQLNCNN